MHKKEVIIIGAGGHGKVIADIIKASGDIVYGFLDDSVKNSKLNILGSIDDYIKYKDKYFVVAIGNNKIRENVVAKLKDVNYYTAIHSFSFVSEDVSLGEGTVVMPGCVINSNAKIGKHCILNSNSTIEHDCVISDFSHISPGAVLCGTVNIGKNTWIGAGAVVKNNLSLCDNVTVGAGGVVVKNISVEGTYVGIPCKKTN